MDANKLKEATNAAFGKARALRLQQKNERKSSSQSAAELSAAGQFSIAVQTAASKQIRQNDTPTPQLTPVLSKQQKNELIANEPAFPARPLVSRTPVSAKEKKLDTPIQTSNLLRFFSPEAAPNQEAHTEKIQSVAIRQHEILKTITEARNASTPQRLPENQVRIHEAIRNENQLENQLIQADLMKQMASLQKTVLLMNERIISLQSISHKETPKATTSAEIKIAALRNVSRAEKDEIRRATNIGSQDSTRSRDGAMIRHLPHTKHGFLRNDFVSEDHDSTPEASSTEPNSSQSSFQISQISDTANVPDPNRRYNLRHSTRTASERAQQIPLEIPRDNCDQDSRDFDPETFSVQLKDYSSEEQCKRCGRFHGYTEQLCTENEDINNADILQLSTAETKFRMVTKILLRFTISPQQVESESEREGCAGKRVPGRRMVEENPCLGDGCLPPFFAYAVSV